MRMRSKLELKFRTYWPAVGHFGFNPRWLLTIQQFPGEDIAFSTINVLIFDVIRQCAAVIRPPDIVRRMSAELFTML